MALTPVALLGRTTTVKSKLDRLRAEIIKANHVDMGNELLRAIIIMEWMETRLEAMKGHSRPKTYRKTIRG